MSDRYLIETHAHTSTVSPCGRLSPAVLAREYARAGYSGIIVTDHLAHTLPIFQDAASWTEKVHRFFSGFREVQDAARQYGLSVFPGFELTFAHGRGQDFLVYGIDEPLLAQMPDVCTMDLRSFKPLAEDAGALIFQAHPFRNSHAVAPDLIDGLEVCNGNPRHDSGNHLAEAYAAKHGLSASSGSDTHQIEDVARCGIALSAMPQSIHDLLRLWRRQPERIELLMLSETRR